MEEFRTIAKLWPSGTELNLGIDSNLLSGNATFQRQAANFVTDGAQNYQFLFWNTGRRATNKRNVKWIFSVLGWGVWTATKWYGTPGGPGGPGSQTILADAFSIGGDQSLGSATPIDPPPASTWPAGASPVNGNDHVVSTANGQVILAAKDPYDNYDFAGWLQMKFGGDDTGEFVETDAGTGGTIGGVGFYDHVPGATFTGAQSSDALLLATYGYHHRDIPERYDPRRLRDLIYEVLFEDPRRRPDPFAPFTDTNPIDRLRMKFIEELLTQSRPGSGGEGDFERLIERAPTMSRDELKRAVLTIKTTLELGKTALGAIESQLKGK